MIKVNFYVTYRPMLVPITAEKQLFETKIYKYRLMANIAKFWWEIGTIISMHLATDITDFNIYYCEEEE